MDLGYEHPGFVLLAEIMKVVGKLHLYLHNSADSFKSIAKKLDVVEDKLRFLFPDSLQRVKPHKEEAVAAWLRRLENATHDATRLLDDVESELKACGSPISMAWLSSDNRNMIRISYIIGKLASVCSEGETIIDENSLEDEKKGVVSLSRVAMTGQNKSLLDDDFLIGRDEEIALVRDMILKNDQYLTTATPLEVREEAEKLHIPQKGWITETLRKIDLSERAKQATEVYPYAENEMGKKVEYIHLHRSTDAHLRNPAVIPIVGISGVGKSALAKFIFNDGNVRKHFGDRSAWVYMTDKIDQLELVKKIICSFDSKYALNYTINLEGACIKLQNIIEGKRFLLVLDDVWDEIYVIWDDLRSVLIKGAPGSVVLVTTQLYSVANYVGTAGPVILDPLQSDDAWTLFKHYAFVDPSSNLSRGLETIGRNIINILPRLPLAVKVIGVTLRSKLEESNWEMLLKSWWWNISDDNFATRVISSLGSSYSTLPGYLRQCFVYCSIFPRNYVFKKDMLVQMWVANDFVQLNSSTGTTRLEDIAGEWFEELVDRAFFQTSVPETGYIMHDLVWDFASALSSNECHGISNKSNDVSHDVRYLSVDMEGLKALPDNFNIKQLRTILFIGDIDHLSSNETYLPLGRIFDGSISLRLLAFSCSLGAEIQNDMSALKHLRYLDLSFTGIRVVPDSVCSLCQLQVLDLRGCAFDKLPGNMNCLINLRHLHASSDTIAQIDGIGKLTKLQDLQEYRVQAEDGHRITELSNMNDLRGSLCISHLEMVTDPSDALEANIVKKNYVTALELRWSDTLPEELTPDMSKWILGCLSPPKYLQELKIYGYSGLAFPDCLGQLKHIRVIEISSCGNLQVLPPLGQLEHLQKLSLHQLDSIKVIGSEFYGNSNVVFRSLEELTFGSLLYWESWTYPGSIEFIPNLKRLRIYQCYELSSVPFESLGSATREMIFYFSCHHADTVSRYLQRLTCLTHLSINGGRPGSGKLILPCKQLGSLEYLHMELFNDVCIRGGLWYIRNLKHLWIIECRTRVTELDEEFAQEDGKQAPIQIDRVMHSLTHLSLGGGSTLIDLENVIPQTPSLRNLCLDRVMSFTSITEKWLQRLTSLQELELFRCTLLPSSLSSLSSLKRFSLKDCNRIYSIPPNSLPGNLKELQIEGCSLELEARCQNPNGEVWRPEGNTIELWRKRKIDEWQNRKLEYGQRKLIEMKQKKESLEIPISRKEKSPNSSKEDSLGQRMQGGHEWPRKQLMDEQSFIKREKPSSPSEQLEENKSEKEPLEEWLQQSEGDKWPPDGRREMNSWLMRKLKKSLDRNNDVPSNLMKEREEWLKEEEHKFRRETVGKDWPNISHVPYIRVNKQIVQNLYF